MRMLHGMPQMSGIRFWPMMNPPPVIGFAGSSGTATSKCRCSPDA